MSINNLPQLAPGELEPAVDLVTVYHKKTGEEMKLQLSAIAASPSGVAGAIQFSNGSAFASDATNFFWNNTTKRLGIGTNNPQDRCEINGNIRVGSSAFVYSSAGGGAVTSGMYFDSATPKASVYVGSTERVIFGNSTVATIKGSGTTSGTASFLVQNSSGSNAFAITDDRVLNFYNQIQGPLLRASSNLACSSFQTQNYAALWMVVDDTTNFGNVNFGATTAVASARVQIDSTTKGFLPPRMTTTEKNLIASPAAGLVVYDSTTNKLCCYNGSTWNDLF